MEKRVLVGKAKNDPTHVVVIGQDVYEMSHDANMPNGVCIYSGNVDQDPDLAYWVKSRLANGHVNESDWPDGLRSQVERLRG